LACSRPIDRFPIDFETVLGFHPVIAAVVGNFDQLLSPIIVSEFERARVLLAEVFVVRKQIPVQVCNAAHIRVVKNLTDRPALGDQFEDFGLDVCDLLIGESSARPPKVFSSEAAFFAISTWSIIQLF
jgi:hypothetical protein